MNSGILQLWTLSDVLLDIVQKHVCKFMGHILHCSVLRVYPLPYTRTSWPPCAVRLIFILSRNTLEYTYVLEIHTNYTLFGFAVMRMWLGSSLIEFQMERNETKQTQHVHSAKFRNQRIVSQQPFLIKSRFSDRKLPGV